MTRSPARTLIALAAVAAAFTLAARADAAGISRGHVYTATNDAAGNMLMVYQRGEAGTLSLAQQLPTQGRGTSAGLGSQGAVTLSQDGQYLFVVNAGSRSLSTFRLSADGATLASTVDAGGDMPISVTESHGIVYVLDAGGAGNVAGFVNDGGSLAPIEGSSRPLSGAGVGPAQVSFDRIGRTLVVTEKASGLITTWPVRTDGTLGTAIETASAGTTPFGFSFDDANHLLVSEAQGGETNASSISSYRLGTSTHAPRVVTPALSTQQTAACWTVATPDGRYVYTANAGSGSLSSFRVSGNGTLTLVEAAAETTAGSHPLDLAISPNGRRLLVLNNGLAQIASYAVDAHGHLGAMTSIAVPATSLGLAAD